jgi:predicted metal-dependent enzyme (double-stranded beta helix superfamily)
MSQTKAVSFDLDRFIEDCRAGLREDRSPRAVREVLARAVAEPAAILKTLGEPKRAQVATLHHSSELTVLNVIWAPRMTVMPHDHRMWAIIGIYSGREDNIFWRRIKDETGGRVEAAGAKALSEKDAVPLGQDIVHSVTNPIARFTGAIHVYGGDFFGTARSEWDPETLIEQPYSVEKTLRMFEEANAGYGAR